MQTYRPAPDVHVITSSYPLPGLGFVPINAFVIDGAEPVLIDAGAVVESAQFMAALRSVIDPAALSWLWLTHTDGDHIGCVHELLASNPRLRVVTTYLGLGIMSLFAPLPIDRVRFVNPGDRLELRDRTLTAWRPPAFDNPSTTGVFDSSSRILYSADCFGAMLADPPHDAAALSKQELRDGQVFWATLDAPWLHKVDRAIFARELEAIRRMAPAMILSSHLPAAGAALTERLLGALADVPAAPPFVGPDQAALEAMLEQMARTEIQQPPQPQSTL
jgi:flavorubredoxin